MINLHPRKFIKSRFTDKQWLEIYNARAILEAYRNKIQPYPAFNDEDPLVLPEPHWTARQRDIVTQLQSEVRGWRQKHAETMLALDKLQKKPQSKWG